MIEIENPTKDAPKRNHTGPLAKLAAIIVLVFVMIMTGVLMYEPATQPIKDLNHKASEVKVDPEVEILTLYQKSRNSRLPIELAKIQAELIIQVAAAEKYPVELLVGIIEAETMPPFNPMSRSSASATGLMQILGATDVTIDDERRYDIQYCLEIGCLILRGKLEQNNGNLTQALADYSGGADGYPDRVLTGIGRYVMFRARSGAGIQIVKNEVNHAQ